jgi:protein-disulfide isomerase
MTRPSGSFGGLTLGQALYEARRTVLEEIVGDRLIEAEAKALGLDAPALVEREITATVVVTEADVNAWYDANQSRVQGAPLERVRTPIRDLLREERTKAARAAYVNRLMAKTPVTMALEPPRLDVAEAGRPAKGPAAAPVRIIEFSDFECPFCLRAFPIVGQVLSAYGDQVRLVYRHYPLPNHPNARPAAEAADCAAEQGKFWEFHDRLFADQTRLGVGDLKQHASALGLNTAQFNDCVDTRKFAQQVDADIAAANAAGVSGTPAFFINGRPLSGAQPFEAFKKVIDEELKRAR